MDVNKESIFGTRPWTVFGEGPASEGTALSAQGFNEGKGKAFTSEDIRFTTKGKILYAIILNVSDNQDITIKSLSKKMPLSKSHPITKVSVLGSTGKLTWSRTDAGLSLKVPMTGVVVLKIEGVF